MDYGKASSEVRHGRNKECDRDALREMPEPPGWGRPQTSAWGAWKFVGWDVAKSGVLGCCFIHRPAVMAATCQDAIVLFGDFLTQGSWDLNGIATRLAGKHITLVDRSGAQAPLLRHLRSYIRCTQSWVLWI